MKEIGEDSIDSQALEYRKLSTHLGRVDQRHLIQVHGSE